MPFSFAGAAARFGRGGKWQRDLAVAVLVALFMVLVDGLQGFPLLSDPAGDNDSPMRMVEVADLIAGQGWFDLHQYRMGPVGGFLMHWSRFVDAPIATLVLVLRPLAGSAAAEAAAAVLWPGLLYAAALFLVVRMARRFGGEETLLPAFAIGALALFSAAIFRPGAVDHHNVQLVLALMTMALLIAAERRPAAAAGAGATAALSLVVGMETLPYAALAGMLAALLYLVGGQREARAAAGFGLAFVTVAVASFLATVPPSLWRAPACDAFSLPQMSVAAIAGAGLAGIALSGAAGGSLARRLAALGLLGAVLAAFVALAFPQCLADPYAGLDPRLKAFWLDSVGEAQSFRQVLEASPSLIATYYATPLLALLVLARRLFGRMPERHEIVVASFLAMAFLVSLWQVRGAFFSIPMAAVPLAAWVGGLRLAAEGGSKAVSLKMLAAWLLSFNMLWGTVADTLAGVAKPVPAGKTAEDTAKPGTGEAEAEARKCYRADDYAALAALPRGTVLAISNIGSSILRNTPHRTLAGPYHRNVAGNLATLDAFMGDAAAAAAVVRREGVTIVAVCPGNDETASFLADAPEGFLAGLVAGRTPPWLVPVPGSADAPLKLFTVSGLR